MSFDRFLDKPDVSEAALQKRKIVLMMSITPIIRENTPPLVRDKLLLEIGQSIEELIIENAALNIFNIKLKDDLNAIKRILDNYKTVDVSK